MVIGRDGKSPCANAEPQASAASADPNTARTNEPCNMDVSPTILPSSFLQHNGCLMHCQRRRLRQMRQMAANFA
jgi:hypothetical protein